MKIKRVVLVLLAGVLFSFQQNIYGQFTEFHPELNWKTIEGKNNVVHYHEEAERTARTVLKIAEEVWEPITSLYGYQPDKVHYVIKDIDDYSNGATYFFDNKIEIWASALDYDLRGTHNWLRNVISHEFTHMVQIQASLKLSRTVPAVYLQYLNYEDKRRPDILYGFPNVIVSYPLSTINVPAWFAEGTAQYMRKEFNYDNWDSHRDMILRSYALDGNMLSWNQMGVFSKTSLGNESVYNSGFALVSYIAQKYGEDKLSLINKELRKFSNYTIDAAFKKVLGKDGREIYNEWRNYLTDTYRKRAAEVLSNPIQNDTIATEGFGNFYPVLSPDNKKLLYISNKSGDYFVHSSLFIYDIETKKEKLVKSGIRSNISFIPGSNKVVYSKLGEDNPGWANIHDLYIYDLDSEKETRLTHGLRANNPSVSNDGKKIVFVFQKDGTINLGTVDIEGKNFKRITFYEDGEQVYNPKFSPDDNLIIFDYSYHNGRDIAVVKPDGSGFKYILNSSIDERNAVFHGNNKIYYSCDESGIYNVYSYDLLSGEKNQHTNVTGGAFMADVADNGDIYYAGYTSSGYKIFRINSDGQKKIDITKRYLPVDRELSADLSAGRNNSSTVMQNLANFNDYEIPKYESKDYRGAFTNLSFFPFLRLDNYSTSNNIADKIKPGLYVASTDMLDRYSFFAGGAINKKWERDIFVIFEYRNKLPLLFDLGIKPELAFELYSISRNANSDLLIGENEVDGKTQFDTQIPVDVTYNLFEADFVARHRIFSRENLLEFRFIYSDYTSKIGSFLYQRPEENPIFFQSYKSKYLIARNFQLKFSHVTDVPVIDSDINPIGGSIELQYNYELNKFNPSDSLSNDDGMLVPIYTNHNFHRVELNMKNHFPLWQKHTLSTSLRLGSILGPTVPDFFDYYLGGLIGMKAYPFYAISGNEVAWLNLTYRFPLFTNIDYRLGILYLDKIFLSVNGDIGNAWNGKIPGLSNFKKGVGAELRIKMNSFYLFPTSVFFSANYAFDKYDRIVEHINREVVGYGKEWQFYGGILFDFSF